MKLLITGNPDKGLAKSLCNIWPDARFVSRSTGWDLNDDARLSDLAKLALEFDVFINNSALWRYRQSLLVHDVYAEAKRVDHPLRIVCIGSTTDRTRKASDWLYQQEKIALRNMCNSLGLLSVWAGGPKVSMISFGTLSNNQHKHPDRNCMAMDEAAQYVKWMIDQPLHLSINELSIDPVQEKNRVK